MRAKAHSITFDDAHDVVAIFAAKWHRGIQSYVNGQGGRAVVRLDWGGQNRHWLLTAFDENVPRRTEKSTDSLGDVLAGRLTLQPNRGEEDITPVAADNKPVIPPAPSDPAQGKDWWQSQLTDAGRKIALEAEGLKWPATTGWEYLPVGVRARLLAGNRAMPGGGKPESAVPPPPPPETPSAGSTETPEPERPESTVPPEPERPADYGAANKTFTADMAAKARARLREKLGRLNAGFDPEMALDGLTLAGFHVEAGARRFAAYAKEMLADLGGAARPHLAQWYTAVRMQHGFDARGMDDAQTVDAESARLLEVGHGDQGAIGILMWMFGRTLVGKGLSVVRLQQAPLPRCLLQRVRRRHPRPEVNASPPGGADSAVATLPSASALPTLMLLWCSALCTVPGSDISVWGRCGAVRLSVPAETMFARSSRQSSFFDYEIEKVEAPSVSKPWDVSSGLGGQTLTHPASTEPLRRRRGRSPGRCHLH